MIRVLVIDDSAVYRQFLKKCMEPIPDVEVIGFATDGQDALEQIEQFEKNRSAMPDVVTLDMNMPRMNGIQTLEALSEKHPEIRVIVVAAETPNDVDRTVQVLEMGAFDFVVKPRSSEKEPLRMLREELHSRIVAAGRAPKKTVMQKPGSVLPNRGRRGAATRSSTKRSKPDLVAIGSSTGGPAALHRVLSAIPANYPLPILVVQHMPKLFLESLVSRLERETDLHCLLAEDGMSLQAGCIYVAPGELHMEVVELGASLGIKLHDAAPEHHCRPAVDVMFRSLARLAPAVNTLAVVLTGMGTDGAREAMNLADNGAWVIAQDEASSVVWGMPGETVKLGAAHEVLPVDQIPGAIVASGKAHGAVG